MSKVDDLLAQYKAEHRRSGDADPRPYLEQVRGLDRAELAAHIDRFLASARPPRFDAAAFARFRSDPTRDQLVSDLLDDATLRELVKESGVPRTKLSRELARRLGVPGRDALVRRRLRDVENGDVEIERVRVGVWEALGDLIGQSADRVRRAAENAGGGLLEAADLSFARSALPDAMALSEAVEADDDERLVDQAFYVD
jgi:hypothetical protein